MVAAFWLAVLMPPVFVQPFQQAPETPAAIALAGGRISMQRPCYSLQCLQAGWRLSSAVPSTAPLPTQGNPFALPRGIPARPSALRAPASQREWIASYGSNARFGTRYGIEAISDPGTRVRIEVGSGFRLQPHADDGIGHVGPVARGSLLWLQRVGEHAQLVQQLRVEAGRGDMFVRNSMSLDIDLLPNWTLRSSVDLRHDTAAADTDTQGSVQLRYAF